LASQLDNVGVGGAVIEALERIGRQSGRSSGE
jgi:hypothetical protein